MEFDSFIHDLSPAHEERGSTPDTEQGKVSVSAELSYAQISQPR